MDTEKGRCTGQPDASCEEALGEEYAWDGGE
jgi:hypothetical protein